MKLAKSMTAAVMVATLAGCAQPPMGPTIDVMPAPGKPFSVFQNDVAECRSFAQQQSAGVAEQANNAQVGSALIGTVLGAGLGAAVGGGRGAAVGAGAGAIGGTAVGSNQAVRGTLTAQQLYNNAYAQCMYTHGNQVPGFVAPAGYPPPAYPPVPPPGMAPPPAAYPPPPPGPPPSAPPPGAAPP